MREPMDILRHEHEIILKVVNGLEGLGHAIKRGQDVDPEKLSAAVRFMREFADRCHHAKEEEILFPALIEKGVGDEHGPIAQLLQDHKAGRDYVTALAETVTRYAESRDAVGASAVATAIRHIVKLYLSHIWKENNVLFPMAERLFSQEERQVLYDKFEEAERSIGMDHEKLAAFAHSFDGSAAPTHEEHGAHA